MKKVNLALSACAAILMCGSFAAQAQDSQGNGLDNVQKTKSYQSVVSEKTIDSSIQADNSVFVNHDSNR